jgi:hypothetical protein
MTGGASAPAITGAGRASDTAHPASAAATTGAEGTGRFCDDMSNSTDTDKSTAAAAVIASQSFIEPVGLTRGDRSIAGAATRASPPSAWPVKQPGLVFTSGATW